MIVSRSRFRFLIESSLTRLLVAVVAILAARLFWTASETETGFDSVAIQWRNATIGLVAGDYEPINSRDPVQQAEFWLAEVDRILAENPNDAELAMGAALVLSEPSIEYWPKYRTDKGSGVDEAGIAKQELAFEMACRRRCLSLAERATLLEPNQVEWRRLRAVLLWHHPSYHRDDFTRSEDWPRILGECSTSDARNALYDYLAALAYWNASAKIDYSTSIETIVVRDEAGFAMGLASLDRGLAKREFAIGDADVRAVQKFVGRASMTELEKSQVINRNTVRIAHQMLHREMGHWLEAMAEDALAADDPSSGFKRMRESLSIGDQYARSGFSRKFELASLSTRMVVTARTNRLIEKHGAAVTPADAAEFKRAETEAYEDYYLSRFVGHFTSSRIDDHVRAYLHQRIVAFLIESLPAPLLIAGALAALFRCVARRACTQPASLQTVSVHPLAQAALFLPALLLSFVVFGVAPSEIVSRSVQGWIWTIVVLFAPPCFLLYWLFGRRRRGGFKFSLADLLGGLLAAGLYFGFIAFIASGPMSLLSLPFELGVPARGEPEWTLMQRIQRWNWVIYQWVEYRGLTVALALWLAALSWWYLAKSRRSAGVELPSAPQVLFVAAWLRFISKPLAVFALVLLAIYLAAAPLAIAVNEREYGRRMSIARDPTAFWSQLETRTEAARRDGAAMAQVREEIARDRAKEFLLPEN